MTVAAQGPHASLRPTPLELAVGSALGAQPTDEDLDEADTGLAPLAALEAAVRPALERPPCVVTFSGGRDSSAVLAVAVRVAGSAGLPPPVAASVRFADAPGTGEPEWQELVVDRLGLEEWVRLDVRDELDLVGPVGSAVLRRHGVLHPPHAHLFAYVLERTGARALLTGFGGDQLGDWIRTRLVERGGARRGRLQHRAYSLSPRPLRRRVLRSRVLARPWLTPAGRAAYEEAWLSGAVREPATWNGYLASLLTRRSAHALRWSLDLIGRDTDAAVVHPFMEPVFLASLARAGGRRGLGDRTAIMRLLCAGILPDEVLARASKAHFYHAYLRDPSRAFARRWDGRAGVDATLVDVEALRAAWLELMPHGASALLLQSAWLASAGGQLDETVADLG